MTKPRATPCMIAMGLVLGLSACTNPYDPVQRFVGGGLIGAGSGAAIGAAAAGGHGAALGAAVGGAVGAVTGLTATTITDTTRVTAEDITPHGARRGPPRQTRPRVTERRASFLRRRPR